MCKYYKFTLFPIKIFCSTLILLNKDFVCKKMFQFVCCIHMMLSKKKKKITKLSIRRNDLEEKRIITVLIANVCYHQIKYNIVYNVVNKHILIFYFFIHTSNKSIILVIWLYIRTRWPRSFSLFSKESNTVSFPASLTNWFLSMKREKLM